jgi:tRNA threonylcarbamoyladenosine biosynthesis protein TsaE
MEYDSKSVLETEKIAGNLAKQIGEMRAGERAVVVALEGELGAGKTTFTKAFARALGVKQKLTSPTFVIMRHYEIESRITNHESRNKFKTLIHIDAYRLNNGNELKLLGIEEILKNPGNIILIEWSDRVEEILSAGVIKVHIDHIDENTRRINVSI